MSLEDIGSPPSVRVAIAAFRRLGREAFLRKCGFGQAREYFLVFGFERFDSKAILGAARGYEFPDRGLLRFDQFGGGAATVAPKP